MRPSGRSRSGQPKVRMPKKLVLLHCRIPADGDSQTRATAGCAASTEERKSQPPHPNNPPECHQLYAKAKFKVPHASPRPRMSSPVS